VSKEAIECGGRAFPESHWIAYDRRCFFFNPGGIPGLPLPRMAQTFDYIVAYSVFTNTLRSDMLEIVQELRCMLNRGGAVAFAFIDPHFHSWPGDYQGDNLLWRLERERSVHPEIEIDMESVIRNSRNARWFMLVNGTDIYAESDLLPVYPADQQRTCHVFYTAEFMRTLFPSALVLPPINEEMQHCCILRA
jgi:hypothetical protein